MRKEERYILNNYKNLIVIVATLIAFTILNFIVSNIFYKIFISLAVTLCVYYFSYYSKYKDNFKNKYYFRFFKESYLAGAIFNLGVLFIGVSYNRNNSLLIIGLMFLLIGIAGHKFLKN